MTCTNMIWGKTDRKLKKYRIANPSASFIESLTGYLVVAGAPKKLNNVLFSGTVGLELE